MISTRFWASATPPAIVRPICLSTFWIFITCLSAIKKPALALVSAARTTPSLQVKAQVVVPFLICSAMYSSYRLSLPWWYILYDYQKYNRPDLSIIVYHPHCYLYELTIVTRFIVPIFVLFIIIHFSSVFYNWVVVFRRFWIHFSVFLFVL